MTVRAPKYEITHPDRTLSCQEEIEPCIQRMIDQMTAHGWGTIETISAMKKVLRNLRFAFAEDPYRSDQPVSDTSLLLHLYDD